MRYDYTSHHKYVLVYAQDFYTIWKEIMDLKLLILQLNRFVRDVYESVVKSYTREQNNEGFEVTRSNAFSIASANTFRAVNSDERALSRDKRV